MDSAWNVFLDALERVRPEWLAHVRGHSPAESASESHVLDLPPVDRRPGVRISVEGDEALVEVGLHEQLFVWSPAERIDAVGEVLAYAQRITRGRDYDYPAPPRDEVQRLDEDQRQLLHTVDGILRQQGAVSDLVVNTQSVEPFAVMTLLLPPERLLSVKIYVAPDSFQFNANGADLRLSRLDFGDDGASWIEGCASTLRTLLAHDLRLCLRPALFGGTTGAVHVGSGEHGGSWNGDLLACRGIGRMRTFRNWWSAT